jgi:TrmH family RNA methyltransferase
VIGTEADGLSASLRSACTAAALIPMLGTAESLNLAVASAIMLYAAGRAQR